MDTEEIDTLRELLVKRRENSLEELIKTSLSKKSPTQSIASFGMFVLMLLGMIFSGTTLYNSLDKSIALVQADTNKINASLQEIKTRYYELDRNVREIKEDYIRIKYSIDETKAENRRKQ